MRDGTDGRADGGQARGRTRTSKGILWKSACTSLHLSAKPASAHSALPRLTWYWLSVTPVMRASVKRPMLRSGPPMPQPQSSTSWFGWMPSRSAR